jgi:hypothetical protein
MMLGEDVILRMNPVYAVTSGFNVVGSTIYDKVK